MPSFSVGVDLGGTNLRIAAVSTQGHLLEKITLGVRVIQGRDQVINEMCAAIKTLSAKYKGDGEFFGAGIGVPGIIDMATGMLRKSANLPGWEDYPVRAEIERRLEAPVVLENDANAAALGEQWLGAAQGVANSAIVTLGTGIGGGIVLNGKIWHGMNGMAGEFGHVTVEPDGYSCGCGSHGCAEQYASASAVIRMAREAIASGEALGLARAASSDPEFGARGVYNLAIQGDEHARRIFRTFGRYLGILLSDLINVLNLDMYVIGGGVSSAWDAFAPSMFQELRERSLVYAATAPDDPMRNCAESAKATGQPPAVPADRHSGVSLTRKTTITRALLGSDAGLYGAARVAEQAEWDSPAGKQRIQSSP
jgi:glucokinase